jgi:glucokinase
VYLCGGIAPNLLPALRGDGFRRRFFAKGKVAEAIRGVPVWVVTHPSLGLLGAAAEVLPASE